MFGKAQLPLKESTDEQLMLLVRHGNRTAFEMLYERYFDRLVRFAGTFTKEDHQAQDVVQEVFIKIMEKPEQFDTEKTFSTWAYTITGNLCKNLLRNEQNRQRLRNENATFAHSSSSQLHHKMDYQMLQNKIQTVVESLNDKEKNLFSLRFEHELSMKEIAEIANIPEGSVKSGIYYLLKKLSYHLKEFIHDT